MFKFIKTHWVNFWLILPAFLSCFLGLVFLLILGGGSKLFWIFIFGGFLVVFKYWILWLDKRFIRNVTQSINSKIPKICFKLHIPYLSDSQSLSQFEALFKSIHALQFTVSEKHKYFEGKILPFFSFEIHSLNGQIGYFLRCREPDKNHILTSIQANIPNIIITPCPDPVLYIPNTWEDFQKQKLDLVGADFLPLREDFHPIKTWSKIEIRKNITLFDPIHSLLSVFQEVKNGDHLILQYILRPNLKADWNKKGELYAQKYIKEQALDFENSENTLANRGTDLEQAKTQELQHKIMQTNIYDIRIRFMAVSKYSGVNRYLSYPANFFKQVGGLYQEIIPDDKTKTTKNSNYFPLFDRFYWDFEKIHRQKRIFQAVRSRGWGMSGKAWTITPAELATIFHFPIGDFKNLSQPNYLASDPNQSIPKGIVPWNT
jgi:hypothetical protein